MKTKNQVFLTEQLQKHQLKNKKNNSFDKHLSQFKDDKEVMCPRQKYITNQVTKPNVKVEID